MAEVAKALGDPIRLQLVDVLRKHAGKVCVCELVPLFDISQPTLSHHLKKLRDAGIVDSERRGLWAYYYVLPRRARGADRMAELSPIATDVELLRARRPGRAAASRPRRRPAASTSAAAARRRAARCRSSPPRSRAGRADRADIRESVRERYAGHARLAAERRPRAPLREAEAALLRRRRGREVFGDALYDDEPTRGRHDGRGRRRRSAAACRPRSPTCTRARRCSTSAPAPAPTC